MPQNEPFNLPSVFANSLANETTTFIQQPGPGVPPAGIIGTAQSGPAFVPVDIADNADFETVFGTAQLAVAEENYAMLAANRYFANGGDSIVFVRTLGAGDCKSRLESGGNEGRVNNAGFVVGQEIVNTGTNLVGPNAYAGSTATNPGLLGRTYFLAAFMSESAGSTIFSDADIQVVGQNVAAPIIRGMLFAPSGVVLALSSNLEPNNVAVSADAAYGEFGTSKDGGCNIGTVNLGDAGSSFRLLLNGHKNTAEFPNSIVASLDPQATYQDFVQQGFGAENELPINKSLGDSLYFASVFNTDPTKVQEAGHYLHLHYDIPTSFASVTGSGVVTAASWEGGEPIALLLTSSLTRNTGSVTTTTEIGVPNFENFQDRFADAFTPFVTSQQVKGKRFDLFKFHAYSSGVSRNLRAVVSNIRPDSSSNGFSLFDIAIYDANVSESSLPVPLVTFVNCDLDPSSNDFIARKVGNLHTFYDFDSDTDGRKVVVDGQYPLTNPYVRVEVSSDVSDARVPKSCFPVGFRGIYHLVTSGSSVSGAGSILTGSFSDSSSNTSGITSDALRRVTQPPMPMVERLSLGIPGTEELVRKNGLTWGAQFTTKEKPTKPNALDTIDPTVQALLSYSPSFHTSLQNPWVGDNAGTPDVGGCVLDSDVFNKNAFTLERVAVITGSIQNGRSAILPDPSEWPAAIYVRNGNLPANLNKKKADGTSDKVRFIDPATDFSDIDSRPYLQFSVPFHGGFNGLNVFDEAASKMSDVSVYRERTDTSLTGPKESTTAAYNKSIDILAEKSNADMQLLTIPGIRHRAVTDSAVQAAQEKFNVLFLTDVEEYDESENYVTSSQQDPDLTLTINNFAGRALGSSFAAAYFPNVEIDFELPDIENPILEVPASIAALGMMALNDSVGSSATAPMGKTRGSIASAVDTSVKFLIKDQERLLADNINAFVSEQNADGSIICTSQKTTLAEGSAFDKVNVRRLMIDIRRRVRDIARGFLFEPASQSTLNQFRGAVTGMLNEKSSAGQIADFRVTIDPSEFVNLGNDSSNASNNIKVNIDAFKPLGALFNRKQGSETELKTLRAVVFVRPVQSDVFVELETSVSAEDL